MCVKSLSKLACTGPLLTSTTPVASQVSLHPFGPSQSHMFDFLAALTPARHSNLCFHVAKNASKDI